MAEAIEKITPQALEAEQSVLGAMMLSKDAIDIVAEILRPVHFYKTAHQRIYQAIIDLYEKSEPADLITVSEELKNRGQLEDVGGRAFLAELTEATPGISNVERHAKIVFEKAMLARLIETSNRALLKAYQPIDDVDEFIDDIEQDIFAIKDEKLKGTTVPIGEILHETFKTIESYAGRDGYITGVPTGFIDLDSLTSGFQSSELIIVACRPSVGKTAFSLNITDHVAVDKKIPVLVFSLEMSKEQIAQRLLCSRARVSSHLLRTGKLPDSKWTELSMAAGPLSDSPIFIDDTPSLSVLEMRAKSRRLKSRENIGLIIIDYLQLVQGPKNAESRQQEISYISRSLKAMARELKVPVLALSQLSRQIELRGRDAKPQLSDLRESGAIEQDADVVIFIHRPRNDEGQWGDEAEILLSKQRNGPTGNIELMFIKDYARFELKDITHEFP